jgi:DNA-directed RNA polymerase I, II, and III subunit RPABC1
MEKFMIKSKFQLPIILKTDAMAKYLGLKNGDIIKITRVSPTAGEYVVYRCCV